MQSVDNERMIELRLNAMGTPEGCVRDLTTYLNKRYPSDHPITIIHGRWFKEGSLGNMFHWCDPRRAWYIVSKGVGDPMQNVHAFRGQVMLRVDNKTLQCHRCKEEPEKKVKAGILLAFMNRRIRNAGK